MNIFIFPTDERNSQVAVIYHLSKLGHKVFLPKFGTLGLPWKKIATWPMLLYKASSDKTKRNIDIHGFDRDNKEFFGEDYFLCTEEIGELYDEDVSCEIIDLDEDDIEIDAYVTLRGGENELPLYFEIAEKYFSRALWISSTMNAWNSSPGGRTTKNALKFVPALYEDVKFENNFNIFLTDFDKKLLNVADVPRNKRIGCASFNHNFHVRHPEDWKLFCDMNALLINCNVSPVPNYGGNVRAQGADVRYTLDNGIVGKFETLSPRKALQKFYSSRAIVHYKSYDWGGGVVLTTFSSCTPIVTTNRYVKASNAQKYIVDGDNAIIIDTAEQAALAVIELTCGSSYKVFVERMKEKKQKLMCDDYWNGLQTFLDNLK